MVAEYSKKEIEDLIDGKLPFSMMHKMLSSFKDPSRFDTYLEILQDRVSWDDLILLPYGLHLYIVKKPDGQRIVKCDCGHEFGSYQENWKLEASIRVRKTDDELQEIYPAMMHCDPEWMELREYFCPGCWSLLEVEAVPPGYPVVFDFLPDLETFYQQWLGRQIP
ncbi:MAG: acetone carboxylase subunit gamma [Deltaproteobacteria bacterium]|jgi:acetone carboxylase gamma subunit|nr:acetone carboxylase subunit gamma [Deltaproteobacteria bacterium]MBW2481386.1 acetone carboxylase subunit gamma [Deltaproteobacteria bacterium]